MKTLMYLDCEFNGFGGDLISMALIDERGGSWYEVLPCSDPVPWVKENVMPILQKDPVSREEFTWRLQAFLTQYDQIHIIADWPEDIAYFCRALLTTPGRRIMTPPLSMEIIDVSYQSKVPHNALEDAIAIRTAHMCLYST